MDRRSFAAGALLVLVVAGCTNGSTVAAVDDAFVDIGAGLHGPTGSAAGIYAQGLAHASAFALDVEGRLWVATADYTDSGSDGVYLVTAAGTTAVPVLAGLHTPLGLLWHDESLYVSGAGGVVAYGGFDGTRFATQRTVVTLPAGVGEVNGLALGPDGRVWLGISAPCDHCTPTTEYAGAVVSFLPDGSDLRVDAGGIRAPVGLAFVPGTADLLVTMNQRDDLGDATPADWLALVATGQAWGFPDCYGQGGTACAGVPGPVAALDRHAAVSGLAIVQSGSGATREATAFVAEWALGRVQRVTLTGSARETVGIVAPFLTGLKNPVPVLAGADGTLFVGDWTTGIVYRITS